ncbi:MAG: GNAT family N-acetyltransferase, partial [Candidatus Omnitrophica bacterium]|nr:GNAT family N-acetyltransferase [Candidatus Omnitrophota bacterium]
MKKLIKWLVALGFYYTGLFYLYRKAIKPRLIRNNLVILRYHRILSDGKKDGINISVNKGSFENQIEYIGKHFKVLDTGNIIERLKRGERFTEPTLAITFDDGYKNNYTYAYPILRRYSIPATIFLTANYINENKTFSWDKEIAKYGDSYDTAMLTWQEIGEMAKGGISFGSHTLTHPKLSEISLEDAKKEIFESGIMLKEKLGKEAVTFSYPHGSLDIPVKNLVKEARYTAAFVSTDGFYSDRNDLFELRRKAIHENLVTNPFGKFSRCLFALEIEGVFDLLFRLLRPDFIGARNDGADYTDKIESLNYQWNKLLERSETKNNVFLTYDWIKTWWEVYGENKGLFVIDVWDGPKLIGIAPLYIQRGMLKEVRLLGDNEVCSDHLGFILDQEHKEEAFRKIVEALEENKNKWDFINFEGIDQGQIDLFERYFGKANHIFQKKPYTTCPYINLPGTWQAYEDTLSQKRAKYFTRNIRILTEKHNAEFITYKNMGSFDEAFNHLVRLHKGRWEERDSRGGTFSNDKIIAFHKRMGILLADQNKLVLNFLKIGNEIAAVLYGFKYGDRYMFYQSGFDDRWKKFSVGSLIVAQSIKDAIAFGYGEFDFLRGDAEYKTIWTDKARTEFKIIVYQKKLSCLVFRLYSGIKLTIKRVIKKIVPTMVRERLKKRLLRRNDTLTVDNKTKILYLVSGLGLGGAEKQ